jgi:hypothetical protein
MDAIFKIASSEFNEELFKKIEALVKGTNADVTIAVHDKSKDVIKETNDEYWNRLNKSVNDIETGKGVTFSMETLDMLINK